MAENDFVKGTMNVDAQQRTFNSVMKWSGLVGLPASVGVGAMVASLLLGAGFSSLIVFFATFVFVRVGVKMFFAH